MDGKGKGFPGLSEENDILQEELEHKDKKVENMCTILLFAGLYEENDILQEELEHKDKKSRIFLTFYYLQVCMKRMIFCEEKWIIKMKKSRKCPESVKCGSLWWRNELVLTTF